MSIMSLKTQEDGMFEFFKKKNINIKNTVLIFKLYQKVVFFHP